MMSTLGVIRSAALVGIVAALSLTAPGVLRADEGEDFTKGKDRKKGDIVQLDLSKLPPDLAKSLRKLSEGDKKEIAPKIAPPLTYGKGKQPELTTGKGKLSQPDFGKGTARQLPPGLASKPANHPGRIAFLKNAGQKNPVEKNTEPTGKGKKKKSEKDDD